MLKVESSHPDGCRDGEINFIFLHNGVLIKKVYFKVPIDFTISGDLAAATAIAMRPLHDDFMEFNFPISAHAKAIAHRDYKIIIKSADGVEPLTRPTDNYYLNFSGGVDSLAAHHLLGPRVRLISVDFGGYFKREADWFRKWDTHVVETNLRAKPFNESLDWRFMASGALLFAEYLHIGSIFWGTILEASPFWFSNTVKRSPDSYAPTHVFGIAGLKICQSVTPLSEYGTTKVALKFGDDTLLNSIASCAAPGTEKFFRKQLLRSIALGEELPSDELLANAPQKKYLFGSSFGPDILTAYFVWKYGGKFVKQYVAELNPEAESVLCNLNMSFFERYNPSNLPSVPNIKRDRICSEYFNSGISPYTNADFIALQVCREYMQKLHKFS